MNEGFRCNYIKTNKYAMFVVCVGEQVKGFICDVIFDLKVKEKIIFYKFINILTKSFYVSFIESRKIEST